MILADKIVTLRKKAGWSQEELAQQLNVTRQSVSKWEGAQSIPDMEKILQMSRIFGVTIDFLLKDEMETAEAAPETETTAARRVTMEEASRYLELRRQAAPKMALATLLCDVVSGCAADAVCGQPSNRPALVFPRRPPWAWELCVLLVLVTAGVFPVSRSAPPAAGSFAFWRKSPSKRNTA
ncbi:MAG: helix-turn-helix domain-containing protein [Lachnospiraceae bacterium]